VRLAGGAGQRGGEWWGQQRVIQHGQRIQLKRRKDQNIKGLKMKKGLTRWSLAPFLLSSCYLPSKNSQIFFLFVIYVRVNCNFWSSFSYENQTCLHQINFQFYFWICLPHIWKIDRGLCVNIYFVYILPLGEEASKQFSSPGVDFRQVLPNITLKQKILFQK